MHNITIILLLFSVSYATVVQSEEIDASDPTRIYTYAGGGIKYSDYSNGDTMIELRATGNTGLTANDMVMFEFGYGWHSGDVANNTGNENAVTNARFRWFHLFEMDYDVVSGYRGLATQVDLQLAGNLIGTDGQNMVTIGALPAFGLSENWSFFLGLNWVNSWDKNFELYNGMGLGIAPLFVYSADWWPGSYIQIWPTYTRFISGDFEGEGAGNIDIITGGEITSNLLWSTVVQKNVDKDLRAFRRGRNLNLENDWNIFFSVTQYF